MKHAFYVVLLSSVSILYADFSLTYSLDYEKLKFKYRDASNSKLLISSAYTKKALYTIKDISYLVKVINNKAKTIPIQREPQMLVDPMQTDVNYKIKKYKKKELIAGVMGTKWMVYGHEGGQVYSQIIYVTNEDKVVKAINAMFYSLSQTTDDPNLKYNFFEIEPGFVIIKAEGMRLKYFQEIVLPTSEYILPKSPNPQAYFK